MVKLHSKGKYASIESFYLDNGGSSYRESTVLAGATMVPAFGLYNPEWCIPYRNWDSKRINFSKN